MTEEEGRFGMFVLEGDRFDAPGVPVEALLELVTYRELIVDVAKQCYMRDHPERERSRRNLDQNFDLRLDTVLDGSADLLIRRNTSGGTLIADGQVEDYYGESRNLVSDAIASVGAGGGLPKSFPRKSIPKFKNFGKTIQPGQKLRLSDPHGAHQAYMTAGTRERFLDLISVSAKEVQQEIAGQIVELDTERAIFHLRLEDGSRIPCSYGFLVTSVDRELLSDENGDGPLVSVKGDALVTSTGTIQRFTTVAALELPGLDETLRKLEEISRLPAGWLDRSSQGLKPAVYAAARAALLELGSVPDGFAPAPLPDGGLRFEWVRGSAEYVLEFEADGGIYMCLLPESPSHDQDLKLTRHDAVILERFVLGGELD